MNPVELGLRGTRWDRIDGVGGDIAVVDVLVVEPCLDLPITADCCRHNRERFAVLPCLRESVFVELVVAVEVW